MRLYTDTQRLYWILQNRPDFDDDNEKWWVVYHKRVDGVSRKVVSYGKNYVEAIDAALDNNYSVVD